MKIYVTGVAGFIGFHLAKKLCSEGIKVFGIDNINNYYDVDLKKARLKILKKEKNFFFTKIDIKNFKKLSNHIKHVKPDILYHLAAQAGVRYSIDYPEEYVSANVQGFLNVLESIKKTKIKHLFYASSSSVYGSNVEYPFKSSDRTDTPISLYAATKKSNELMAHAYYKLFQINSTGLRFFTVYGPWGRPDMALFKFTKSILERKKIEVFNHGKMVRDFTYIDDVVNALVLLKDKPFPKGNKIYNIGCETPVTLNKFISLIENGLKLKAKKRLLKMQLGDVKKTYSDSQEIYKFINYTPQTSIEVGVKNFLYWYLLFYKYNS